MFEVTYLFLVCGVHWQNNVHKSPSGTPGWLTALGNFSLWVSIILRQQKFEENSVLICPRYVWDSYLHYRVCTPENWPVYFNSVKCRSHFTHLCSISSNMTIRIHTNLEIQSIIGYGLICITVPTNNVLLKINTVIMVIVIIYKCLQLDLDLQ